MLKQVLGIVLVVRNPNIKFLSETSKYYNQKNCFSVITSKNLFFSLYLRLVTDPDLLVVRPRKIVLSGNPFVKDFGR